MKTSADGIALLHYFESCRLKAYPDPATKGAPWSIGWGDTGPDVVPGLVITQDEADQRFADRLALEFEPGVMQAIKVEAEQHQFDAFVCLAYNIGLRNFSGSTLVRMFNSRMDGVENEFLKWNRAGGKVMLGLRRRREAERSRYLGAGFKEAVRNASLVK